MVATAATPPTLREAAGRTPVIMRPLSRLSMRTASSLLLLLLPLLGSCARREPRPFALREENCGYCRMTISDPRFGGEFVRDNGRVVAFDAIECLASYVRENAAAHGTPYVIDFRHPGRFVKASEAVFLRSSDRSSPMGPGVIAVSARDAAAAQRELGGTQMRWSDVLSMVHEAAHVAP